MPHGFNNIDFEVELRTPAKLVSALSEPFTVPPGGVIGLDVDGTPLSLSLNPTDSTVAEIVTTLTPQTSLLSFSEDSGKLVIQTSGVGQNATVSLTGGSALPVFDFNTGDQGSTVLGVPADWSLGGTTVFQPLPMGHEEFSFVDNFTEGWAASDYEGLFVNLAMSFTVQGVPSQPVETFRGHTTTTLNHFAPILPESPLLFDGGTEEICIFESFVAGGPIVDLTFDGGSVCTFDILPAIPEGPLIFNNPLGSNNTETFRHFAPGHVLVNGDLTGASSGSARLEIAYSIGSFSNTLVYELTASEINGSPGSLASKFSIYNQFQEMINNDQTAGFFTAKFLFDRTSTPFGLWISCTIPGVEYKVDVSPTINGAEKYPATLPGGQDEGWWWYYDSFEGLPYQLAEDPDFLDPTGP